MSASNASGSNGQFSVVSNAATQVIIDTYGVFIAPQPTALECTTVTGTNAFFDIVAATCPPGYSLTGGGCHSDSPYDYTYMAYPYNATDYSCGYVPLPGHSPGTIVAYAQCCRVPGR